MARIVVSALAALVLGTVSPSTCSAQSIEDRLVRQVTKMDVLDHADLVLRLRKELDKRLLTPDPKWQQVKPKGDEAGINKILARGRWERQTYVRGGGAYFSFETRSNDYDSRPDLQLDRFRRLSSGFAGGDFGVVVQMQGSKLGDLRIEDLPKWMTDPDAPAFEQIVRSDRRESPEAIVGRIYAVRSVRWGESDRLVVFRILADDEFGITFAWKVLQVRDVPSRK